MNAFGFALISVNYPFSPSTPTQLSSYPCPKFPPTPLPSSPPFSLPHPSHWIHFSAFVQRFFPEKSHATLQMALLDSCKYFDDQFALSEMMLSMACDTEYATRVQTALDDGTTFERRAFCKCALNAYASAGMRRCTLPVHDGFFDND